MWTCKHCNKEFKDFTLNQKANHSRWCDKNPKSSIYKSALEKARGAKTIEGRRNAADKLKKLHAAGVYAHVNKKNFLGKTHTSETISVLREKALSSNHRRLKKNMIEYNGIMLDSSWELALAKRLDFLGITWVRPEPIKWIDEENIAHNYFPDFYLPDYDLYLDPKNPAAMTAQSKKVSILKEQVKNLVFLQTLDECNSFIVS